MPFGFSNKGLNAIARITGTAALILMLALGSAGVYRVRRDISKSTYDRKIQVWEVGSGSALGNTGSLTLNVGTRGWIDVNGNVSFSGSIRTQGVLLNSGAVVTQTTADSRYVNVSGDTMTGAFAILKQSGTSTGNTLTVDTKGLIYDATNKRVGIGTATPSVALHVIGNTTTSGRMGIATTAPAADLHIAGTSGTILMTSSLTTATDVGQKNTRLLLLNNSSTVNGGGEVIFGAEDMATERFIVLGSDIKSNTAGGSTGDFYIATKAATTDTAPVRRVVVSAAGRVGIGAGVTSPGSALSLSGAMIINVNGNLGSTAAAAPLHVVGSDTAGIMLVAGTTKAIRMATSSTYGIVSATDNTGFGTYQPLLLNGSTVTLGIGNEAQVYLAATANVGIDTASPGSKLAVSGSVVIGKNIGSTAGLAGSMLDIDGGAGGAVSIARLYSSDNTGLDLLTDTASARAGIIRFRRSTGTFGSPTTVANGSILGVVAGYGHDGTDYETQAAFIRFEAAGSVSTNVVPGRINFFTAPTTGSDGIREVMRVGAAGNLGLGTQIDAGSRLAVSGSTIINPNGNLSNGAANAGTALEVIGAMSGASLVVNGGSPVVGIRSATATLDFANLASIGCEDLTITVTGAATGDVVDLGVPNASAVANGAFSAWVSSANTVSVRFCTVLSGDPASGTFRVQVNQF